MFYQIYDLLDFEYFNYVFIEGLVQVVVFLLVLGTLFWVSNKNPGFEENQDRLSLNVRTI